MNKILLLLFFVLFSCQTCKYCKEENILEDFLKSDNFLEQNKCIVLIPSYGCGLCTQDIISFSKENYKNNKLHFIFIELDKQKSYSFKFLKDFNNFIDNDLSSELVSQGLVENKPVVYFIKDEHIHEIVKFDDSISDEIIQRIKDSIK